MKKLYTMKFFLSYFLCLTSYVITHAQAGEWTWMKGSNSQGGTASFGTQGVEASTNTPEALYGTCNWTDKQKKFWLIGGYGSSDYATALWKFDPVRDSWIDDTMQQIQRDFFPPDLLPLLQRNGFIGCVAVQASQAEVETLFLMELSKTHDIIKGVVGWVDLQKENESNSDIILEKALSYLKTLK